MLFCDTSQSLLLVILHQAIISMKVISEFSRHTPPIKSLPRTITNPHHGRVLVVDCDDDDDDKVIYKNYMMSTTLHVLVVKSKEKTCHVSKGNYDFLPYYLCQLI